MAMTATHMTDRDVPGGGRPGGEAPDGGQPHGGRSIGSGIVLGGDRTKEYNRARRGTIRVRMLRFILPLTGVVVIGVYGAHIARNAGIGTSIDAAAIRKILPTDLVMKNPHYEGFGKDGAAYVFDAKTAEQDLLKPNSIKLNSITGVLTHADKTKTNVVATSGHYDHTTGILDLFESIDVTSDSGLKAKLTRATIVAKESILTSPEPVDIAFPSGTIRSKSMELRQKAREVTFVDEVVANLTPPAKPETAVEAPKRPNDTAAMFKSDGGPIIVTAGRLDANDTTKIATFSGDVTAVQADAKLTTSELEITYDGQGLMGTGGSEKKAEGEADPTAKSPAGKISRIVAKEPVVMTRGDTEHVTTRSATFDAQGGSAVLIGDVVMTSGVDRRAVSDRVDLDQTNDTALLIGDVVVTQGENELKGRRFFINRKAGTAQLTSPPGIGEGPGRIAARLSRGAPKPGAQKTKPAKPAAETGGFASFKTDPNAPVTIDADLLDINDTAKQAVFRGEVQAVQGDFVIKSAELTAHYKGDSGLAGAAPPAQQKPPAAGQAAKPAQATELTKIEAKRNVIITSSEGQTASGDWAEYNAKSNMVTMGGNVVLARGQNMVRGTRLLIDMTTGQSKIDTAPAATAAQQGPAGVAATGGRASAVFFPEQMREAVEKKKPGAPSAVPGNSAPVDGWSATTEPAAPSPRN